MVRSYLCVYCVPYVPAKVCGRPPPAHLHDFLEDAAGMPVRRRAAGLRFTGAAGEQRGRGSSSGGSGGGDGGTSFARAGEVGETSKRMGGNGRTGRASDGAKN